MKYAHLETVIKTGFLLKSDCAACGHCRVDSKQEESPVERALQKHPQEYFQ